MKKLAAIFFASLLLFNAVGYRWVFDYMDELASISLDKKVEAGQYSDAQLVEIKIPLNMPYIQDSEFESMVGEVDFQGYHYRFVKRKIQNNVLHLLCLPNFERNNIAAVKADLIKDLNDIPLDNGTNNNTSFVKLIFSDFIQSEKQSLDINHHNNSAMLKARNTKLASQFSPFTLIQPPDLS